MTRLFVTCILLLLCPLPSFAHGLGVEAKLNNNRVFIEAYFDNDTPADDAKILVTDETGKEVLKGKTDLNGAWSFPAPAAGNYKVSVNAGGGHSAKTTFTIPNNIDALRASEVNLTESVIVSDGPTRTMFTGPMRWVMAATGLGLIAVIFLVARQLSRKKSPSPSLEPAHH